MMLSSVAENRQSDAERRDAEEQTDAQLQTTAFKEPHSDTGDTCLCANKSDSLHVMVIKIFIFILKTHQICRTILKTSKNF